MNCAKSKLTTIEEVKEMSKNVLLNATSAFVTFVKSMRISKIISFYRAILGQLENVVKNIYPEGATFAGMLGHMPFLLKDN